MRQIRTIRWSGTSSIARSTSQLQDFATLIVRLPNRDRKPCGHDSFRNRSSRPDLEVLQQPLTRTSYRQSASLPTPVKERTSRRCSEVAQFIVRRSCFASWTGLVCFNSTPLLLAIGTSAGRRRSRSQRARCIGRSSPFGRIGVTMCGNDWTCQQRDPRYLEAHS